MTIDLLRQFLDEELLSKEERDSFIYSLTEAIKKGGGGIILGGGRFDIEAWPSKNIVIIHDDMMLYSNKTEQECTWDEFVSRVRSDECF